MAKTGFLEYDIHVNACKKIFLLKMGDYGNSWRVLRTSSVIDQIYIKVKRIRTIDEKGFQKIADDIVSEFTAIMNYAVIGLMQEKLGVYRLPEKLSEPEKTPAKRIQQLYDSITRKARLLMESKNHDYGDAWREMQISSFTDLILMKLMRIRRIEENRGQTLTSEGIDSNLYDIINYAVFALITLTLQSGLKKASALDGEK